LYTNRTWCQQQLVLTDTFSWLASIRMASEDVSCGERMIRDSDRLTSGLGPGLRWTSLYSAAPYPVTEPLYGEG